MSYELIETVELTSSAASIEFTSIPQDGTDLVCVLSGRGSSTTAFAFLGVNSDTTNYARVDIRRDNANVSSQSFTGFRPLGPTAETAYTANTFGNTELYISNYAGSTAKSISVNGTSENNGTNIQQIISAASYTQTTAITSIQLTGISGNLVAGSTASLYKITAA